MKHKLNLHYTIINCGDGSATITFMESQELAEWSQADENGWGEPCLGTIELESESPIIVNETIETKESFLIELFDNDDERIPDFIEQFFPNGVPEISVKVDPASIDEDYPRNLIFMNGVEVGYLYEMKNESGDVLAARLNKLVS